MKTTRNFTRQRLINTFLPLLLICILGLLAALFAPTLRPGAPQHSAAAETKFSTPSPSSNSAQATTLTTERAREAYGRMELSFEANHGQTDASVNFLARGAGYTLFLKPAEAVFVMARQGATPVRKDADRAPKTNGNAGIVPTERVTTARASKGVSGEPPLTLSMKLVGADAGATVEGADELAGKVNYFKGDDPAKWRTNVPTFGRVRYKEVYPGIDVVYYGNQRQLEYDFVVAPGRDARAVSLEFAGADKLEVDAGGDLLLTVGGEVVRQRKPVIYQEAAGGARREVEGGYVLQPRGRVGFHVGEYDAERPLVIDPILVYSTYLGGSGTDDGNDIKVDSAGNAYICGNTSSTNFPTANAFQATFGGANFEGGRDGFITKLNATGSGFIYSTYLGGSGDDRCNKIAVDSTGNAYVVGESISTNFPRANAFQNTYGGGLSDATITKLNANGDALVFSTYLGGSIFDAGNGIALDSSNNVYITGRTTSANFPTANAIQAAQASQSADAYVTKLNAAGNALVYSTYLGGSDGTEGGFDAGFSIAVDSAGGAYVTGQTRSTNFPTVNAVQSTFGGGFPDGDAFVTKINAAGNAFAYS
ncbi:MAG TPA: SBBP repeat-containing protein, partial [Pyrinomonadaceae bacterium]